MWVQMYTVTSASNSVTLKMVAVHFSKTREQSTLHGVKPQNTTIIQATRSLTTATKVLHNKSTWKPNPHTQLWYWDLNDAFPSYRNVFHYVTECLRSPDSNAGCKRCTFCSRFVNINTVQHRSFLLWRKLSSLLANMNRGYFVEAYIRKKSYKKWCSKFGSQFPGVLVPFKSTTY